jgi:predicted enzyme related to lactoylglutathione lyase
MHGPLRPAIRPPACSVEPSALRREKFMNLITMRPSPRRQRARLAALGAAALAAMLSATALLSAASAQTTNPYPRSDRAPRSEAFQAVYIQVANLESMLTYYKALGYTEQFRDETKTQYRAGIDVASNKQGPHLLFLQNKDGTNFAQGKLNRFAFYVADLDAMLKRVGAAGGKVIRGPIDLKEHGVKVAFTQDPEGNTLEFLEITR